MPSIEALSFWYEPFRAFQPGTVNAEPLNLGMIQIPADLAKLYTSFELKLSD